MLTSILKEAEIENLRIHDLRRTLGSYQAATGANGYIIGKSLGHKSQQSTAIYARLNLDPVRESVNKATDVMFGYMGVNAEDESEETNAKKPLNRDHFIKFTNHTKKSV